MSRVRLVKPCRARVANSDESVLLFGDYTLEAHDYFVGNVHFNDRVMVEVVGGPGVQYVVMTKDLRKAAASTEDVRVDEQARQAQAQDEIERGWGCA